MMRKLRVFGAVALTAILATAASACGSDAGGAGSADSTTEVNFGYIGDYNGTSLLAVAEDQGLWAKHGLEAKTKVFTNGPLQIQALGTGDLDFGYIGPGAMWLPATGKAKIVSINTLGNADRVIAQPGINSLADLKGKTIGVPEGTSGDMILTLALQSAGLSKSDVKVTPMDAATVVPAFSSKKIDAAGIWYPAIDTIKKQVPDLVELAKNDDFAEQVSFPTAFVASNQIVDTKKDTVTAVDRVLREAMDYRAANADKTVQLTAAMLKLDPATVAADAKNSEAMTAAQLDTMTADGTITKWLTGMNKYFEATGKVPSGVDPKSYYEADLFVAAGK